jgi:hypothetical protein
MFFYPCAIWTLYIKLYVGYFCLPMEGTYIVQAWDILKIFLVVAAYIKSIKVQIYDFSIMIKKSRYSKVLVIQRWFNARLKSVLIFDPFVCVYIIIMSCLSTVPWWVARHC